MASTPSGISWEVTFPVCNTGVKVTFGIPPNLFGEGRIQ
jgi:hypothetical protein